jgi:uncharacterized RDD family membrane protein YckC
VTTLAPERDLSLQGHYAGIMTRGAAFLLDVLAVLTVFALAGHVIEFFISSLRGSGFSFSDHRTLSAMMLAAWAFFYGSYSLSVRGRTPGKAVIGLRVVRSDGHDLSAGRAVLRTALLALSLLLLAVSVLLTLLRRDRRSLHDLLADTAVVYAWDASAARLRLLARPGGP